MAIFNSKQFVYQAGYLLKFDLFFLSSNPAPWLMAVVRNLGGPPPVMILCYIYPP